MSRATFARRCSAFAGWLLPGSVLALMPKCPLCFAAYVAMATGLGMTASTAGQLRQWTIALCVMALGLLALRQIRRWFGSRAASRPRKCCS